MKITPLDVKEKRFGTTADGGLSADEVYEFMRLVKDEFESLLFDNSELKGRLFIYEKQIEESQKRIISGLENVETQLKDYKDFRKTQIIIGQVQVQEETGLNVLSLLSSK